MAELSCTCKRGVDIITLSGIFDDEDVPILKKTISTLRQQGSTKIVLLGGEIQSIKTRTLNQLAPTVRTFRNTGGRFALAEFDRSDIELFKQTIVYRHVNVFKTKGEALRFMCPSDSTIDVKDE